ncbi:hypothetical protein WAI453_013705 [Rhynchosporium graminicola]
MPLPHDEIVSIAISNGGWFDKEFVDRCYYIYTFGTCSDIDWANERSGVCIKANGSQHAVRIAYNILNKYSAEYVNIHNSFNFDLRRLSCWSAGDDDVEDTFEERRLGNVGSICERFDLPGKEAPDKFDIDAASDYDHTPMVKYNCRDSDLQAWLVKRMLMCERIAILAGVARSTIWDSIANNTGGHDLLFDPVRSHIHGFDVGLEQELEDPVPGCYKGVIMIDSNSLYGSLIYYLQIFIDRCISGSSPRELRDRLVEDLPHGIDEMLPDDIIWNTVMIVVRSKNNYIAILQGTPTILTEIIGELIKKRKRYESGFVHDPDLGRSRSFWSASTAQ